MFLLGRKPGNDQTDWFDSRTEFTDKDHFVAYTSRRLNNETRRRTFYFSILEDKVKFLAEAKKCIERLQDTSEKY